jgi:hypothetical protein
VTRGTHEQSRFSAMAQHRKIGGIAKSAISHHEAES